MSGYRVSIGVFGAQDLFGGSASGFLDLARMAEDTPGIDQITFTDHVVMGERSDRYPYGPFPVPPEYPWFEPLTMLTAVAAVTRRLRLATGVLISPLRPAALLAKTAATLDVLSGGRLDLGVGVGWQREEYLAQGQDFDSRWRQFDRQLALLKRFWSEAPVALGEEQGGNLYSKPFPQQAGGVPLWFGVAPTPRQARRIAAFGVGWVPISHNPTYISDGAGRIREAFAAAGRNPDELMVRAHARINYMADGKANLDETLESVEAIVAAGATHIEFEVAPFVRSPDDLPDFLRRVARRDAA